jgi:hypothetical protein
LPWTHHRTVRDRANDNIFMYERPFYISENVSNNSFSYDKRPGRRLYVPSLIDGCLEDVKAGPEIVFEDFDDFRNLKGLRPCTGLKHFLRTDWRGKPVYVCDNHNHAFAFWHLEAIRGAVRTGASLVHMDQHKDSRQPARFLTNEQAHDPDVVFNYTNTVLNVGNFIPAALKTGLVAKVINLDSEASMREFDLSALETGNVIFDLDLDFFAPEMDYIASDLKLEMIRAISGKAAVVTIATSPFFIDQKLALDWLGKIAVIF